MFFYRRCHACGLVYVDPLPDDLSRYYDSNYHGIPQDSPAIEAGAAHDRYKIDLVLRYMRGGQLLEIGPAWGAFCLLAKRAGFSVEAVEMNEACCRFLADTIGIRAIHTADEVDGLDRASPPDVIALWHVLEHVPDPWRLLSRAVDVLRPGGLLVVAMPNPESLQFRLFGRRWAHLDAPRHVRLFPARTFADCVESLGLRRRLLTTLDAGSVGWDDFGWRFSLANLATGPALRRVLRFAGRFVTPLMKPIERREGQGSAYTAIFSKPKRDS